VLIGLVATGALTLGLAPSWRSYDEPPPEERDR
jgi:hypothetical protein